MIRNEENVAGHDNAVGDAPRNDGKEPSMFLQKPPNFDQPNKPASSVSNNAAENPELVNEK